MDDKKAIASLNQTNYEIFSEEINNLHWKDFEELVINIFKKIFDSSHIEIKHTQFSHDGGRDGEGIFNILQNQEESDFKIQIKIWIEVKKRSAKVSGHDIGLHALTAFLNKVSFVIFASNSSFDPQVKETLASLSNSHNINHDLIDGERLFKLYQKYTINIDNNINQFQSSSDPIENKPKIEIFYSKRPLKRYLKESINVEINEPFYVFVDFNFKNCIRNYINKYTLFADNIRFFPYDISPLTNAQKLNCKTTHIWIGLPQEKTSNSTVKVSFSSKCDDYNEIASKIDVEKPLFTFKTPYSARLKTDKLKELLIDWFNSGEYKATILYGNAGTGKTYLVNHFRQLWLQENILEVILDGEIENSESVLLNRFFQDVFPIPMGLINEKHENNIFEFLISHQLPSKSAQKLANIICTKKEIDTREFSSDILSDLLYFLIKKKSEQRKTIFVYEDIHKCQPSVIQLLIKIHRRLIYEDVKNVFFLLCSRKSASFKNQETLKEWLFYVEEILEDQDIKPINIEPYSTNEALSIVQDVIFSMSEIDASKIIDQVGTTPFGLKEALFYMYQKGWIEYDLKIKQFMFNKYSFTSLKTAIESNVFTQVTKSRISELKQVIPQWASTFIDIGACFGTSFSKEWCFKALGSIIDENEINNFLALSGKLGILKNSYIYTEYLRFDHDLVRASLLNSLGEIKFRKLSSRLFEVIPDKPINYKQKAFLAFQGSIPSAVELFSERYGDESIETEVYEDALEAYKMALYVVDQNMMTGNRETNESLWFVDDALNIARENQVALELPVEIRKKKTLSLCKKIVDTASHIGSGGQEIIKTFTTEGLMLARFLNDYQLLGIFHIRYGIYLFDKKDIGKSIIEFRKALNYLPVSDYYNRGHALIELAISLRHMGNKTESFTILKQALKEAGNKSPEIKLRVFANAGSLYFNTDWEYTRRYWLQALKVAEKWNNAHYLVHMLIDIAHLELLDCRFDEAEKYYQLAYEKAQRSGLKSQEFKIDLHRSILVLTKDEDDESQLLCAEMYLKQAEMIGITYSIDRKLWRVYANWANVLELKIKKSSDKSIEEINRLWNLMYVYDKKAIGEFKKTIQTKSNVDLINNRRIIPLLINVYLRSPNSNYPNQDIFESINIEVLDYIKSISNMIENNNINQIPQNISKFLKPLLGINRFIFT